jgi:hypothetical protein
MWLFSLYKKAYPNIVKDLSEIDNNSVYDHNINDAQGFEYSHGHKKIYFIADKPYCKNLTNKLPSQDNSVLSENPENSFIRFNTLHFQGGAKNFMKYIFEKDLKGYYRSLSLNYLYRATRRRFAPLKKLLKKLKLWKNER